MNPVLFQETLFYHVTNFTLVERNFRRGWQALCSIDWQNTRELCVQGNWAAEYLYNQWLRIKDSCYIARWCYLQDHCLQIWSTWIVCWTFFAFLMNGWLHTDIHSNNRFIFFFCMFVKNINQIWVVVGLL